MCVMSLSGSPGTATMSAHLPAVSEPTCSSQPRSLARAGRAGDDRLHRRQSAPRGHERELVRVGAVLAHARIRTERDLHACGLRDLDGIPHRLRRVERLLAAESLEHAVVRGLLHCLAGAQRRHEIRSPGRHHLCAFLVEKGAVLDRAHAGANRDLDALGAVRVRRNLAPELRSPRRPSPAALRRCTATRPPHRPRRARRRSRTS